MDIIDLIAFERKFWLAGAGFYRDHLVDECLMLLPGVGIVTRAEAIEGIEQGPRWTDVEIRNERALKTGADSRLLCYEATARRGETEYSALAGSVYVRRGDGWKLAFHQQTSVS